MKLPTQYALYVAASLLLLGAFQRDRVFEARAVAAEHYVAAQRDTIDSLSRMATAAAAQAAHTDTVRVITTRRIAIIDSTSHPDTTCGPSLAARDKVIGADSTEIHDLQSAYHAQMVAMGKLRASNDTLSDVLASRPRAGVTLSLFHPTLHISLQAMVYPTPRIGIGVSYDLADIHL